MNIFRSVSSSDRIAKLRSRMVDALNKRDISKFISLLPDIDKREKTNANKILSSRSLIEYLIENEDYEMFVLILNAFGNITFFSFPLSDVARDIVTFVIRSNNVRLIEFVMNKMISDVLPSAQGRVLEVWIEAIASIIDDEHTIREILSIILRDDRELFINFISSILIIFLRDTRCSICVRALLDVSSQYIDVYDLRSIIFTYRDSDSDYERDIASDAYMFLSARDKDKESLLPV